MYSMSSSNMDHILIYEYINSNESLLKNLYCITLLTVVVVAKLHKYYKQRRQDNHYKKIPEPKFSVKTSMF